jgi:hypothetical protein
MKIKALLFLPIHTLCYRQTAAARHSVSNKARRAMTGVGTSPIIGRPVGRWHGGKTGE